MIFVNSSLFDQSLERNVRGFLIMVSFSMLIANEIHIMLLLSLSEYFFDESFFFMARSFDASPTPQDKWFGWDVVVNWSIYSQT